MSKKSEAPPADDEKKPKSRGKSQKARHSTLNYYVGKGNFSIGRSSENNIVLNFESVNDVHAELRISEHKAEIRSLSSVTTINKIVLKRGIWMALTYGDEISFNSIKGRFSSYDSEARREIYDKDMEEFFDGPSTSHKTNIWRGKSVKRTSYGCENSRQEPYVFNIVKVSGIPNTSIMRSESKRYSTSKSSSNLGSSSSSSASDNSDSDIEFAPTQIINGSEDVETNCVECCNKYTHPTSEKVSSLNESNSPLVDCPFNISASNKNLSCFESDTSLDVFEDTCSVEKKKITLASNDYDGSNCSTVLPSEEVNPPRSSTPVNDFPETSVFDFINHTFTGSHTENMEDTDFKKAKAKLLNSHSYVADDSGKFTVILNASLGCKHSSATASNFIDAETCSLPNQASRAALDSRFANESLKLEITNLETGERIPHSLLIQKSEKRLRHVSVRLYLGKSSSKCEEIAVRNSVNAKVKDLCKLYDLQSPQIYELSSSTSLVPDILVLSSASSRPDMTLRVTFDNNSNLPSYDDLPPTQPITRKVCSETCNNTSITQSSSSIVDLNLSLDDGCQDCSTKDAFETKNDSSECIKQPINIVRKTPSRRISARISTCNNTSITQSSSSNVDLNLSLNDGSQDCSTKDAFETKNDSSECIKQPISVVKKTPSRPISARISRNFQKNSQTKNLSDSESREKGKKDLEISSKIMTRSSFPKSSTKADNNKQRYDSRQIKKLANCSTTEHYKRLPVSKRSYLNTRSKHNSLSKNITKVGNSSCDSLHSNSLISENDSNEVHGAALNDSCSKQISNLKNAENINLTCKNSILHDEAINDNPNEEQSKNSKLNKIPKKRSKQTDAQTCNEAYAMNSSKRLRSSKIPLLQQDKLLQKDKPGVNFQNEEMQNEICSPHTMTRRSQVIDGKLQHEPQNEILNHCKRTLRSTPRLNSFEVYNKTKSYLGNDCKSKDKQVTCSSMRKKNSHGQGTSNDNPISLRLRSRSHPNALKMRKSKTPTQNSVYPKSNKNLQFPLVTTTDHKVVSNESKLNPVNKTKSFEQCHSIALKKSECSEKGNKNFDKKSLTDLSKRNTSNPQELSIQERYKLPSATQVIKVADVYIMTPERTLVQQESFFIMFTGDGNESVVEVVKELGGVVVEDVHIATHLVANQVKRTLKFMCAVGKGLPIVTKNWLVQSKNANCFLDCMPYLLHDECAEANYNFSLKRTLIHASAKPLLTSWNIYVTRNVQPPPIQLKDMIEASGGKYLQTMPTKRMQSVFIVSTPEDALNYRNAFCHGFPVVDVEFILTGLLIYKLDFRQFTIPIQGGESSI